MLWDVAWYFVIGLSVMFYVVLDGFDLGVGMMGPFIKKDEERRVLLNAIGPVWDGNEVWLVIVGGALFAGFPDVYATLFSGFYNTCMILLFGLIFRAAAIEFRSKMPSPSWRKFWDNMFSSASLIIAFGLGFVLGNLVEGVPLNEHKDIVAPFFSFFKPYPLLVGIMSTALFMLHGVTFLLIKTESELQNRLRRLAFPCFYFFLASYFVTTTVTWMHLPYMTERMCQFPALFALPLAALLAIVAIPYHILKKQDGMAFICSSSAICLLFLLFGVGTFPVLIFSSIDPSYNLTIFNAAASTLTLKVLMLIVAIGIPLVLAYGFYIYRTFRER